MNSETNGQSTTDTSRKEGWQEEQRQDNLQQQACAAPRGSARKRDRIVYIENSSNCHEPFIVKEVGTVCELIRGICQRFPEICIETLGMKVSSSRSGTIHRVFYEEDLPYEQDTIYVGLYLRKHS